VLEDCLGPRQVCKAEVPRVQHRPNTVQPNEHFVCKRDRQSSLPLGEVGKGIVYSLRTSDRLPAGAQEHPDCSHPRPATAQAVRQSLTATQVSIVAIMQDIISSKMRHDATSGVVTARWQYQSAQASYAGDRIWDRRHGRLAEVTVKSSAHSKARWDIISIKRPYEPDRPLDSHGLEAHHCRRVRWCERTRLPKLLFYPPDRPPVLHGLRAHHRRKVR